MNGLCPIALRRFSAPAPSLPVESSLLNVEGSPSAPAPIDLGQEAAGRPAALLHPSTPAARLEISNSGGRRWPEVAAGASAAAVSSAPPPSLPVETSLLNVGCSPPAVGPLISSPASFHAFAAAARAAGCPVDQMQNYVRAGVLPQPRQLDACAAARSCDLSGGPTAVGFGGARGGGKSHWLFAQLGVDDCQRFPGLKCLLLRKVGKSNLEHFEDLRRRLFHRLPHDFNASRGVLTFANDSRIFLGHFQCEKDIDAYLGLEYDVIGIEEATTLSARKYHDIATCCRSSKPGWRPRLYSTTNPGGVGHAWYRTLYVIPFQLRREQETRFIPATVADNAFTNADYRRVLARLSGWQKRAWLEGDWDIAAGQFFSSFRRELHVLKDFDPHLAVEWFAALDHGFAHYTVALLGCRDGDGNIYVVDEHAARGWVTERHAEAIKAMFLRHGVAQREINSRPYSRPLARFLAGADIFARQAAGVTIADAYRRCGLILRPAVTDRLNGWAEITRRFGNPEAGCPASLFIHPNCRRLIETIPLLQHDPARPEDVLKVDPDDDGLGGDDAADALRYLVAFKPARIHVTRLRGF